jgi:glycosyltransferase involved in cell wall biosynthesis
MESIPVEKLRAIGHDTEIVIVDNGSTDGTGALARQLGATVVVQPVRGYGNAYKAGFANCSGDIIATGDADLTYPFEILPEVVENFLADDIDFLTTNRLDDLSPDAMTRSHVWGNKCLSEIARRLFGLPFADSQSGMWVFRREVWAGLRMHSGGMGFSQEIKIEAFRYGFSCREIPIVYRPRGGETKMRTVTDGMRNLAELLAVRMRAVRPPAPSTYPALPVRPAVPETGPPVAACTCGAGTVPNPAW